MIGARLCPVGLLGFECLVEATVEELFFFRRGLPSRELFQILRLLRNAAAKKRSGTSGKREENEKAER